MSSQQARNGLNLRSRLKHFSRNGCRCFNELRSGSFRYGTFSKNDPRVQHCLLVPGPNCCSLLLSVLILARCDIGCSLHPQCSLHWEVVELQLAGEYFHRYLRDTAVNLFLLALRRVAQIHTLFIVCPGGIYFIRSEGLASGETAAAFATSSAKLVYLCHPALESPN